MGDLRFGIASILSGQGVVRLKSVRPDNVDAAEERKVGNGVSRARRSVVLVDGCIFFFEYRIEDRESLPRDRDFPVTRAQPGRRLLFSFYYRRPEDAPIVLLGS